MSAIQAKLDQRGKIYNQMLDLKNRAKNDDRSLTDEEKGQWDTMYTDYQKIGEEIKGINKDLSIDETMERLAMEQKSVFDNTDRSDREKVTIKKGSYKRAIDKWFRDPKSLNSSDMKALTAERELRMRKITGEELPEGVEVRGTNVQITSTDSLGGYIVPDEWVPELVRTMEAHAGMLEAGRIIQTSHGRQLHVPTVPFFGGGASATQKGVRIGENVSSALNDVNLGEKLLDAYVYSSGEIVWTWEMMQDSMFPIVPLTLEIGGERVGAIVNQELTTGTGSSQPNGAVTASSLGKTAASATAITGDEVVDLKHSVNRAYRRSARCYFMMNDATLAYITKLSYGTTDTSVWVPSFAQGVPDTILGHPYIINDDMASIATANKTILFGDFGKYWIRKAGFPELARSDERDIANRRSVFYVFDRYDGELVDANAVKHLIQA